MYVFYICEYILLLDNYFCVDLWQGLDVLVVWFRVVVWSWWLWREEAVFVCWSYFGLEQQLPPQQRQQQGLRPFLSIRSTLLFSPSFMTIESNTIFVFSFLCWRLPKTKSKAKSQKSTNSKESMNIDSCNIIHKKRRN